MTIGPPFITRPGPRSIPPDEMPGGVVIHVYSVPTCRLLLTRHAHDRDDVERHAEADAAQTADMLWPDDAGVCLVAYDGDTGERMPWHG